MYVSVSWRPSGIPDKSVIIDAASAGWSSRKDQNCLEVYEKVSYEESVAFLKQLIVWGHTCYSYDTDILTKDGWKRFYELNKDDLVYTLNPNTHEIELEDIKRTFEHDYSGDMYKIDNEQVNLLVTPNHKLYVCKDRFNDYSSDYKLVEAQNLGYRKWYFKKNGMWSGKNEKYFILGNNKIDMKLFLQFLGIYLSDGCIQNCGDGHYRIRIVQTKPTTIGFMRDVLIAITRTLDRKLSYYNNREFCTNHKELVLYLEKFGKAKQKYVPDFIKELSPDLINIFLYAYTIGDGSFYENGNIKGISTSSIRMANDLQELFLKVGKSANIKTRKQPERGTYQKGIAYWVGVVNKKNTPAFRPDLYPSTFYKEKYVGKVYCVETNNGIIYVRRNGKAVWSGNSVLEHIVFKFHASLTVACASQLTRHRMASYTQKSYRRAREFGELSRPFIVPPQLSVDDILSWVDDMMTHIDIYNKWLQKGYTSDVARFHLPQGLATNIAITMNARSLRNLFGMRLAKHAMFEFQELCKQMLNLIKEEGLYFLFEDVIKEII